MTIPAPVAWLLVGLIALSAAAAVYQPPSHCRLHTVDRAVHCTRVP
jgi:hypothetical protein